VDTSKQKIMSVKIGPDLQALLSEVANVSDFIRKAIQAQYRVTCSLCRGTGVVPRGIGEHFAPFLQDDARRNPPPAPTG
jgi:hypothetical protein